MSRFICCFLNKALKKLANWEMLIEEFDQTCGYSNPCTLGWSAALLTQWTSSPLPDKEDSYLALTFSRTGYVDGESYICAFQLFYTNQEIPVDLVHYYLDSSYNTAKETNNETRRSGVSCAPRFWQRLSIVFVLCHEFLGFPSKHSVHW